MLISPALAAHGVADTGSSGGAIALLIILAVVIGLFFAYMALRKWRERAQERDRSSK
ncbi:MAG: hypothetical protein ACFCUQ_09920 [Kiloniellales bacterium]